MTGVTLTRRDDLCFQVTELIVKIITGGIYIYIYIYRQLPNSLFLKIIATRFLSPKLLMECSQAK